MKVASPHAALGGMLSATRKANDKYDLGQSANSLRGASTIGDLRTPGAGRWIANDRFRYTAGVCIGNYRRMALDAASF